MARDKTFEERRREREKEDARAEETPALGTKVPTSGSSEKFAELMGRAEPLLNQVDHLYQQYFIGFESKPPKERREHLDQLMSSLQLMGKTTQANQFRFSTLQSTYRTYVERWERMARDLESGKLKRRVTPKR